MHIVVCVKQTPVATAERNLDSNYLLDRESADNAMNGYDEVAVEEALRMQEAHGGSVTALSMGPGEASETLRKALAMGVDRAVLVVDPALRGSDVAATALVLATAIASLAPEMALVGMRSDDAGTGVLPGALAQCLGWPLLSHANTVEIQGFEVRTHRRLSDGYAAQATAMPAVVAVTDAINIARYPTLKGIMAARKKALEHWSLETLGIDRARVGSTAARTRVVSYEVPPQRTRGDLHIGAADAAERIVDFLAARKVL